MRLINLDKLLDDIHRTVKESGLVNHECEIMDCIEYADIIDTDIEAEPVRHGKWVDDNSGNHDSRDTWFMCLCCGYHTTSIWIADYKYCPHCGAKMDLND